MMFGESKEERIRLEAYGVLSRERARLKTRMVERGFPANRMWWLESPSEERIGWRLVLLRQSLDAYEQGFPPEDVERVLAEVCVTDAPDTITPGRVLHAEAVDHVHRARMRRAWYGIAGAAVAAGVAAVVLGG